MKCWNALQTDRFGFQIRHVISFDRYWNRRCDKRRIWFRDIVWVYHQEICQFCRVIFYEESIILVKSASRQKSFVDQTNGHWWIHETDLDEHLDFLTSTYCCAILVQIVGGDRRPELQKESTLWQVWRPIPTIYVKRYQQNVARMRINDDAYEGRETVGMSENLFKLIHEALHKYLRSLQNDNVIEQLSGRCDVQAYWEICAKLLASRSGGSSSSIISLSQLYGVSLRHRVDMLIVSSLVDFWTSNELCQMLYHSHQTVVFQW